MTDLERALSEITAIRGQMARATRFRGLGPVTTLATGAVALAAGSLQGALIKAPLQHLGAYLDLWVAAAILSLLLIGLEMITRSRRLHSNLADAMIRAAALDLAPAGAAGALITWVIIAYAPEAVWMLPGLWQIFFGIAVLAACRSLPHSLALIGVWYVGCGLIYLAHAHGGYALSAWSMAAPFALGQALAAVLLHLNIEPSLDRAQS